MKRCPRCDKTKPLEEFYKRHTTGGVQPYCISCTKERNKKYVRTDAKRANLRKRRDACRRRVIAKYGGVCTCCGEDEYAFLVMDHVDGGGTQDRGKSPHTVYARLDREPVSPDYQVHCANCNMAKERKEGCPHAERTASTKATA